MRSTAIATALFVAGAIAEPAVEKRAVEWVTAIDTVVQTVWVTHDGPSPTSVPAPASASVQVEAKVQHTHAVISSVIPVPESSAAPILVPSPSTSVEAIAASAPAPVASVESAAAPAPSAAASGSLQDVSVAAHNQLRSAHQVGAVTWNQELADSAQALSDTCVFGHNVNLGPASTYGQNIAISSGTLDLHSAASEVNNVIGTEWGTNEETVFQSMNLYGVANPLSSDFDAWGHFTQEVWAQTEEVGCAVTTCGSGYYVVCNYSPPGNYAGDFGSNVLPSA